MYSTIIHLQTHSQKSIILFITMIFVQVHLLFIIIPLSYHHYYPNVDSTGH